MVMRCADGVVARAEWITAIWAIGCRPATLPVGSYQHREGHIAAPAVFSRYLAWPNQDNPDPGTTKPAKFGGFQAVPPTGFEPVPPP